MLIYTQNNFTSGFKYNMQISGSNYNFYMINRTISPSFCGYQTAFSKQLDKVILKHKCNNSDAVKLTELLNDFIKKHLNIKKKLGSGFHGSVYKIDDKYVLKMPNTGANLFFFENLQKQKFGSLKTYYGEPVANFRHGKILKNVYSQGRHLQAGIPENMIGQCLPEDCMQYYEQIYLPCFASVPQRAFDAIAKDFDRLNKMGRGFTNYTFDFKNPNNFVLAGSTLRITDEITTVTTRNPNSMAEMLSVFLSKTNINTFAQYSKVAEKPRKELFKKIIRAGMKCNLELGTCPADKILWDTAIKDLCRLKVNTDNVIFVLQTFQKEIPNTRLRLNTTKAYLDSICGTTL